MRTYRAVATCILLGELFDSGSQAPSGSWQAQQERVLDHNIIGPSWIEILPVCSGGGAP
jgi:hypothetical protein